MQPDIEDEAKRQYEETVKRAQSIDTKIAIVLGFIFTTIGLLLDKDFLSLVFKSGPYGIAFFALGLFFISYAVYCGIHAVFFRKFSGGPKIATLLENYESGPEQDFRWFIADQLQKSDEDNQKVLATKVRYGERTFIIFFIGLLEIILLKVGLFGAMS